ncbi:MAG: methyltransferase [Clostridia bacterium]|nr:methyltransferase [Clostridia bacterium]
MAETTGLRLDVVNDDLKLYQYRDGLTFGTDALLLAAYVRGDAEARAVEFGGGTGIVSLLLAVRRKVGSILSLEIQKEYADLIERNAAENGLSDRVQGVFCDLRDTSACPGPFDLVVTNPPYLKVGAGLQNRSDKKNAARRETAGDIADFCRAAGEKLRTGGRFVCVYLPDRLSDLLVAMRAAGIEAKRMTVVSSDPASLPSLVLVEGRRGGAPGMKLTRPLFLYRDASHTAPSGEMQIILDTGDFPAGYGNGTDPKEKGKSV